MKVSLRVCEREWEREGARVYVCVYEWKWASVCIGVTKPKLYILISQRVDIISGLSVVYWYPS